MPKLFDVFYELSYQYYVEAETREEAKEKADKLFITELTKTDLKNDFRIDIEEVKED